MVFTQRNWRWQGPGWVQVAVMLAVVALTAPCRAEDPSRKVIAKTAPSYPELAKKMHLTGKVKMELVIAPSGAVTSAKLVGGSPVFESSAREAVKQWRFEPAKTETKEVIVLEFDDH